MRRYIQYEPFNIYLFEAAEWQHPVHKHSYFEIIFIRQGAGQHCINGNTFAYQAGDVFLLGPEDYHYFEIRQATAFCYIRFTEAFIKAQRVARSANWFRTIDLLLNTPYQSCGSLVPGPKEQEMLQHLLAVLLHEYDNRRESAYELIQDGLMNALLGIIARNLIRQVAGEGKPARKPQLIEDIFLYIRQQIREPGNLRLEKLVEKFNYSPGYLSVYFKKQTGESLQQYILRYKLKMVENRLLFSDSPISRITDEFGFTDGSHLTRIFKKYYGLSPQAFRLQGGNSAAAGG